MSLLQTIILLTSVALTAAAGGCFRYVRKQNRMIEDAIAKINLFLGGDTDIRIECNREGRLNRLFHAINTLATTLDAFGTKEQQRKEFLKNTIADISHQLKTPLAALNIYNSILQDDSEGPEARKEYALKSERELERIGVLIQNLLKMTRLDAGTIIMEKRRENVAQMMEEMVSGFETRGEREGKKIVWSGPAEVWLICDRNWIPEAIGNLVKNALDHTRAGNQITLEWKELPTVIQIAVKDDGKGIHPEDIHHIFKRFYRSRVSTDTQGAGLGLSLTKAVVEAHDGNISVDSVLGSGSIFTLNFSKPPVMIRDRLKDPFSHL